MGEGGALPRLLVHVGAGKTGTSSIQETLRLGREALRARGIAYLGLMLEHAGPKRQDWQVPNGSEMFFRGRPPAQAAEELHAVLADSLAALGAEGVRTAVWSNEWIFQRRDAVLPALQRLRAAGVEVRIACYLRRVDAWIYSAYVQWGIKDKAPRGPVKPFQDWRRGRSFALAPHAEAWAEAFGDALSLRNFDATPDVVADFLGHFLDAADLPPRRANETPDPAVLAAWLVHNSGIEEPVRPARFLNLMRHSGVLDAPPAPPPLGAVLPTEADLAAALAEYRPDMARVNALLAASGEPPLDLDGPARRVELPDPWEMQVLLLRMVISLQQQVEELRRQLRAGGRGAAPPGPAPPRAGGPSEPMA